MRFPALLLLLLLPACAGPGTAPADPAGQAHSVRALLVQAADTAVNRLGRPGGYGDNPLARIALPESLARLEKGLRRYGLERYADDLVGSMNHAAEMAVPVAKPALLEAVRTLSLADAAAILHGDNQAATRYFRSHTEAVLAGRFRPLVAEATARAEVAGAYKRLLRKAAAFDRSLDLARFDLDDYVTRQMLAGLYQVMAEEERRLRHGGPAGRSSDLLRQIFR